MKKEYVLLDKEYSAEELCDVGRDVHECYDIFPEDAEVKRIKNKNDESFLAGTYKVKVTYEPDAEEGDYLE